MYRCFLFLLLSSAAFHNLHAQSKAFVLENAWANSLNSYNSTPFFDNVFSLLEIKFKLKEISRNPLSSKVNSTNQEHKEVITKHVNENKDAAYYIAVSSDLSLPLINLTRIIFRVPTRTSKFVFAVNVYNNKAENIFSDTIVNRGCIVKAINDDKMKDFYSSYENFKQDMQCHFEAIRKLWEKK